MVVQFNRYIFIITAVEINSNKYGSFKIRHCTICPTVGRITGKHIIWSFVHLRAMGVVNLVDYFVISVGVEVYTEKINTCYYAYFCTCNYFSLQFYFLYYHTPLLYHDLQF